MFKLQELKKKLEAHRPITIRKTRTPQLFPVAAFSFGMTLF
ncbi:hypothetical protein FLA_6181 [Filimonas lacunae]|nr:hypothetical protein FLA_6181 [Filimonas lacunae]